MNASVRQTLTKHSWVYVYVIPTNQNYPDDQVGETQVDYFRLFRYSNFALLIECIEHFYISAQVFFSVFFFLL